MNDGSGATAGRVRAAALGEGRGLAPWEPYVLPALLALAALMRFPDLATRGTW